MYRAKLSDTLVLAAGCEILQPGAQAGAGGQVGSATGPGFTTINAKVTMQALQQPSHVHTRLLAGLQPLLFPRCDREFTQSAGCGLLQPGAQAGAGAQAGSTAGPRVIVNAQAIAEAGASSGVSFLCCHAMLLDAQCRLQILGSCSLAFSPDFFANGQAAAQATSAAVQKQRSRQ